MSYKSYKLFEAKISPELVISLEEMLHSTADLTPGLQGNIQYFEPYQLSEVMKF